MSADGSIILDWAGEQRRFRLAIGQLRELQENVNRWRTAIGAQPIGPRTLLRSLVDGDAWPDDVREIIRLGLIGGGMKIDRVPMLMRRYLDERPLLESTQVAQAILLVALVGVPDDQTGVSEKKTARDETSETTSSGSPQSTGQDAPSDSAQDKSMQCPSGNSPLASMDSTKPTAPTANQMQ